MFKFLPDHVARERDMGVLPEPTVKVLKRQKKEFSSCRMPLRIWDNKRAHSIWDVPYAYWKKYAYLA